MSETKLKPCPFCGCKNIQFWETDNDKNRFQIVCMQCFNGTDECISEEVAIEKWNCRTPMSNIVEKLEERRIEYELSSIKAPDEISTVYRKGVMRGYEYSRDLVKQEINNGLE